MLKWSLVDLLSKLCMTPSFSINFRSQIENQMSDNKLMEASSFNIDLLMFLMRRVSVYNMLSPKDLCTSDKTQFNLITDEL